MQKMGQNEEIKNMSELKPRITENGIDYILVGDYYIPDLKLPEEHRPIGKYGRMHREYLREVHPARLNTLILTGELWTYLADLNEQAQEDVYKRQPCFSPISERTPRTAEGGFTMRKRYNTPHRSRVVKTRMTEEEYAEFAERLSACNMSQAEFIRQAITGAAIRPIITAVSYTHLVEKHKTWIASPATIPKSGERNRKIHSCMLYLISI